MIVAKLTEDQYALLDMLEDTGLVPAKDEDGNSVDEIDPRVRVIEAQLSELIENFDADAALQIAGMADELMARNTARIKYASQISASAQAGHASANLLVSVLESLMLEHGIDRASNESTQLEIVETASSEKWTIVDAKSVPDEFWHNPDTKRINPNLIAQHFIVSDEPIPGVEMMEMPAKRSLRRR